MSDGKDGEFRAGCGTVIILALVCFMLWNMIQDVNNKVEGIRKEVIQMKEDGK